MGLPSLSEDVLERWLSDAFLQLQRRPSPELLKLIHRELSPRFLELYTTAHCAERELNDVKRNLAAQKAVAQSAQEELVKGHGEIRALRQHVWELQRKIVAAQKRAAEDALHLEQLRKRLAEKEAAAATANAAANSASKEADRLKRLCREKDEQLKAQEQELGFLRKTAMQRLFGENG